MSTIPRNEELNEAAERAMKRLNDEFITQCVERHKRELAQKKQRDIEASGAAENGCVTHGVTKTRS